MNIPFGNMINFMQQYQQFMNMRNQLGMGNNPNQIIQNMMNSGRITQSQYNNTQNLANMISQMTRK